ncbi:hypothetical protein [Deinococcus radiotolerans]|uniref:Bro-N domain-containing protein n=1 Tax=Deinococcus radiotolerans TaxID=1309407 RepID=A0ABQ2FEW8_9DEIO|nr:hypothetical protein [Deinococcus radiotolerans]GGK91590.1 hypothetical protein GCM10010844_07630 [Deinococcus radiotolerans]
MTQILPYVLEVGTQEVVLTPDPTHEFTATTEQVALGYGVSPSTIREQKRSNGEEFVEGKHFLSVRNPDARPGQGAQQVTLWTKRGIVRLGFFIRSARARLFRDMAEDLVIGVMTAPQAGTPALISARGVSAAVGIPPRHASATLRRQGIEATHHFLESRCGAPAYLYPLPDVQAIWPDVTFTPYQGEARPGVAAVVRVVGAAARTKAANRHQPRLLPTDTSTEQLARRLLSLEAQKKAVLRELAALA